MSILTLLILLGILNFVVIKVCGDFKKRWIISSLLVMLLLSPLVFIVYGISIGIASGDGIGGGVAGFLFGVITFINGFVFLITGFFKKMKV